MKDRRARRDVHGLDSEGRVACNPRDREAAHRADVGDLQTAELSKVTCSACRTLLHQARRDNLKRPRS